MAAMNPYLYTSRRGQPDTDDRRDQFDVEARSKSHVHSLFVPSIYRRRTRLGLICPSSRAPGVSCATDRDEPVGFRPRGDLDVRRTERPPGVQRPRDHPMRFGRRQTEEVATEVDGDPSTGAGVLERIPPCRVHAGSQCPPVQERSRHVVAEGGRRRIETQHDRVVEQFHGDEPDSGVEW